MSRYTDWEHERALAETIYWLANKPITAEEQYAYGAYQYRLKDYQEAVVWFKKSAASFFIPAMYKLAYCMRHNLGIISNYKLEMVLFKQVLTHDEHADDAQAKYRLGMCFAYGYGTAVDEEKAISYFHQAKNENIDALYEIGLSYKMGKGNFQIDKKMAAAYFRKAYDEFCEEAIFALFELFDGNQVEFPYVREIKEAYSFKLGRLLRVVELKPSAEYLTRLAYWYQQGYPGDKGEQLEKFQRLSEKYYREARDIATC